MKKYQFIKNCKANYCHKSFRKYNIIEGWYYEDRKCVIHYTKYGIHLIPIEYLKIYKH